MLYADLVSDPVATVEAVYAALDMDFTDAARAASRTYVDTHPREARPAHKLNLGSDELNSRERRAFHRYQTYFAIPYE
jgi:hypothetical protein